MKYGTYDSDNGGHYYWDAEEQLWWTWDTPDAISKKLPAIVEKNGVGGVFAWGLGEDADDFVHLKALTAGMKTHVDREKSGGSRIQDEL